MPLTAAEKQRRYRQRLKEKDLEGVKEKERNRWRRRKAEGKIKSIGDMSARQQRSKRKEWKKTNANRAAKRHCAMEADRIDEVDESVNECLIDTAASSVSSTPSLSRQALRGGKERKRNRSGHLMLTLDGTIASNPLPALLLITLCPADNELFTVFWTSSDS